METDQTTIVRERAHLIWEREGRPHGREAEHWAQAEREIGNEAAAASGTSAAPRVTTADDPTRPAGAAQDEAANRKRRRTA